MAKLQEFIDLGQSIWLDYIRRSFITSGELKALIDKGLRGVTSNPTIFERAIAGSTDYDEDIRRLTAQDKSVEEILKALTLDDIGRVADLLLPVYEALKRADGYVSIEVNPKLAHDASGMVAEAQRFHAALKRPNVMIKIPATPSGIAVTEKLISEGINVNVTLIFSIDQYDQAAKAYIRGLERLAENGGDLTKVSSVASSFVSRVDTAVDRALDKIGDKDLQGKIAIANAKMIYVRFKNLFKGPSWDRLKALGARVQRPLWASTGTKNPSYPDTLYMDNLIGPDTVNTVPPSTLHVILDHGSASNTLELNADEARLLLPRLSNLGVDLDTITRQLQYDGVAAFSKSLDGVTASIADKRDRLLADWRHESASLGRYQSSVDEALAAMTSNRILHRVWAHDHTVWKPDPTEISNRLDWLHIAEVMSENIDRLKDLVDTARFAGYTHALLLGMGGSSLAPEVFIKTFGVRDGYLDMAVLDSTDPGAVLVHSKRSNPAQTLYIVSTKSGGTVETLSFFKFFYNQVASAVGSDRAGEHFVAITDPGSDLGELADRYRFRATFLNNPNIGGRYSALSYYGLVPAALIGVDVPRLLDQAMTVACGCDSSVEAKDNPGAWLGVILGELAKAGRDKVTFFTSAQIASFGDWVEQLIAESTGKEGNGILPVVGEPLGPPEDYSSDRIFVYLQLGDDGTYDSALSSLESAGHPVVRLRLRNSHELGRQFFMWEIATAVAGYRLGINPFDQPNVESSKVLTQRMVSDYITTGTLRAETPALVSSGVALYGDLAASSPGEALVAFLSQAHRGAYVALHAYIQRTGETDGALLAIRNRIRAKSKLSTTVGYGPRFLHSTGQLHKGDAGHGLFIQFTCDSPQDVPIPNDPGSSTSSISFGVLKAAQAMGDQQALLKAGRRVIRFHFDSGVVAGLNRLTEALG